MSIFDRIQDVIGKANQGNASDQEVHAAYDQVAQAVPKDTLAEGLSHTFKSDQTPPFEQMVTNLYQQSNPAQKDPSVMDRAADFYAHHPGLVKAAGAGALAFLMSRMSAMKR